MSGPGRNDTIVPARDPQSGRTEAGVSSDEAMADDMKLIAPRVPTQAPNRPDTGRVTGRLPDDLLSEQIERLAVFSAVIAGLWGFGLVMDTLVVPLLLGLARTLGRHRHRGRRAGCVGGDVSLRPARGPYVRHQGVRGPVVHDCERGWRGVPQHAGHGRQAAGGTAGVVDRRADSHLFDDCAHDAAPDARGVARRRVDGSPGDVDRLSPRLPGASAADDASPLPSELHLAPSSPWCRHACFSAWAGGFGKRRIWAAISWSSCSAGAAWAKSGEPSIGCSPAARRSSSCAPNCSARAATPTRARFSAASSVKPGPPPS